ncbi:hypothetical protein [Teredinibacter haidensis]|uniref:hypothetical protein n=1 Tax=Teredinibacter haidensis TaxID=2731755 RepID=UPI000948FBEE|nr:hypothetical protein [Teredinibacter haidensis]
MTEANPYQAPESVLATENAESIGGSLERGLNGEYDFAIGSTIKKAWSLTKGFKRTYWGAALIVVAVSVVFMLLGIPVKNNVALAIVVQIISYIVIYPLSAGFYMLSVRRAAGREVQAMEITGYFNRTLKIFLLNVLMMVLVAVGLLLLVLPGLYLMVAYMFAVPLMIDKNMGVWAALEASRKTVTHKWFSFFGVFFLVMILVAVAAIPFGIGLIWVLPLVSLVFGVLYTQILGVEAEARE